MQPFVGAFTSALSSIAQLASAIFPQIIDTVIAFASMLEGMVMTGWEKVVEWFGWGADAAWSLTSTAFTALFGEISVTMQGISETIKRRSVGRRVRLQALERVLLDNLLHTL